MHRSPWTRYSVFVAERNCSDRRVPLQIFLDRRKAGFHESMFSELDRAEVSITLKYNSRKRTNYVSIGVGGYAQSPAQ